MEDPLGWSSPADPIAGPEAGHGAAGAGYSPFLDPFQPQDAEEKLKTISSDVAKADAEAKQAIKQVGSLD